MNSHIERLNLKPGATMKEIKAAYRRMAKIYHPDSGSTSADAARFNQVHEAYQTLLRDRGYYKEGPSCPVEPPAEAPAPEWRFEGVAEDGAEVVYVIRVSSAGAATGLEAVLPWKAEDACPRCLGEGHTLAPVFGGPHLARMRCDKCGGSGVVKHNSTVVVPLSPDAIAEGKLRMKGMGHYRPTLGRRGDLVVEILTEKRDRKRPGYDA
jgi:DnaJ-class molecular chaperone